MSGEFVLGHVAVTAGMHLMSRLWRRRLFRYRLYAPNRDVRVVFSALLRIGEGGRYVLVKNLHRPETYAPFGGVVKYFAEAKRSLDAMQFRQDDFGPACDMTDDLRGFVPGRYLDSLLRWYESGEGREATNECLQRELEEELAEIGVAASIRLPKDRQFRTVRVVDEGPTRPPGVSYSQFRLFTVCDLATSGQANALARLLFEEAAVNPGILIASADEIIAGRAQDGRVVASTACYLIRHKRIRPDDAPFVRVRSFGGSNLSRKQV
jgi:hypothetical protein